MKKKKQTENNKWEKLLVKLDKTLSGELHKDERAYMTSHREFAIAKLAGNESRANSYWATTVKLCIKSMDNRDRAIKYGYGRK